MEIFIIELKKVVCIRLGQLRQIYLIPESVPEPYGMFALLAVIDLGKCPRVYR